MALFKKAISEQDLAEALRVDAQGENWKSLNDEGFTRLMSIVDYWDWENDRFPFLLTLWNGAYGPSHACARIGEHHFVDSTCHAKVAYYGEPGVRVTIPLQWCVWQKGDVESGQYTWGLKDWLSQGTFSKFATGKSAYSGKFVRDFYEWFSKPDQNPILKHALNYIEDLEFYRLPDPDNRLYGFSFKVKEKHKAIYQLCALSRVLTDGFYMDTVRSRAALLNKFRDAGFSMRVAFVVAENEASQGGGGHRVLDPYTQNVFNWLTDNPHNDEGDWCSFYKRATPRKYHFPTNDVTVEQLTEYLELLKKDGIEIGPTLAK